MFLPLKFSSEACTVAEVTRAIAKVGKQHQSFSLYQKGAQIGILAVLHAKTFQYLETQIEAFLARLTRDHERKTTTTTAKKPKKRQLNRGELEQGLENIVREQSESARHVVESVEMDVPNRLQGIEPIPVTPIKVSQQSFLEQFETFQKQRQSQLEIKNNFDTQGILEEYKNLIEVAPPPSKIKSTIKKVPNRLRLQDPDIQLRTPFQERRTEIKRPDLDIRPLSDGIQSLSDDFSRAMANYTMSIQIPAELIALARSELLQLSAGFEKTRMDFSHRATSSKGWSDSDRQISPPIEFEQDGLEGYAAGELVRSLHQTEGNSEKTIRTSVAENLVGGKLKEMGCFYLDSLFEQHRMKRQAAAQLFYQLLRGEFVLRQAKPQIFGRIQVGGVN